MVASVVSSPEFTRLQGDGGGTGTKPRGAKTLTLRYDSSIPPKGNKMLYVPQSCFTPPIARSISGRQSTRTAAAGDLMGTMIQSTMGPNLTQ